MADTSAIFPGTSCQERFQSFIRTQKGMILAAEILLSLIVFICYIASWFGGYVGVAIVEMVVAIIFFVVFMMELHKQVKQVNWPWSDFMRAAVGAALYIITSLVCLTRKYGDTPFTAAGALGLIAGLLYTYDTYTVYLQIRSPRQNTEAPTENGV